MGAVRKFASLPNICEEEEGRLGQHMHASTLHNPIHHSRQTEQAFRQT